MSRAAALGVATGDLVGLAVAPDGTAGLAAATGRSIVIDPSSLATEVGALDRDVRPRWVLWDSEHAARLAARGVRLAGCWHLPAVHRLLHGGWRADTARVWALANGLGLDTLPVDGPRNLFSTPDDDDPDAVRPDGHLRPDWVAGAWTVDPARWAALALRVGLAQRDAIAGVSAQAVSTARSESGAELLCAELEADGLPMDRAVAEAIIAGLVGERTSTEVEAARQRAERDAVVLSHVPPGMTFDLRNPAQVKSLLRSLGVEVPDTRAWRLESLRDAHPGVAALLEWRKAERIATTFGYAWLDEHLGPDGRLRGEWTGSDGAAGRMTASAGLHNMPALMRPAVVAEPGHVFVRADLGQIEPRVLAAVSGDDSLARATLDDDLYLPVARALGVDRPTAKVAVLGAMYGQTTGHGAAALRRLDAAYPVAMRYLMAADLDGQAGRDLRTHGGRLVRMGDNSVDALDDPALERDARSRAAARGRYGRNAMVQGAAAELFKVWALTVRLRGRVLGAQIVLCLHDELLVHLPTEAADDGVQMVHECLREAAHRWSPTSRVRFVADVTVVDRWSDAKG